MKPLETSAGFLQPRAIKYSEIDGVMSKLRKDHDVDTFLGTMMTTQGVLVLLFSHRFNRDHALLVSGTDTANVLTKVFEVLE